MLDKPGLAQGFNMLLGQFSVFRRQVFRRLLVLVERGVVPAVGVQPMPCRDHFLRVGGFDLGWGHFFTLSASDSRKMFSALKSAPFTSGSDSNMR